MKKQDDFSFQLNSEHPLSGDYRCSREKDEIEALIRYFCNCQVPLTAWQRQGENRIITQVKMVGLNPFSSEIRVEPQIPSDNLNRFDLNEQINLHANVKKFVTQTALNYLSMDHLYLKFPMEIYTEENRSKPRRQFFSDQFKVGFKKRDTFHEYPLIDVSESGMAFKVPVGPASLFNYRDDEIQISSFYSQGLEEHIKANIVYIKGLPEANRFRVGVRFQKELSEEIKRPQIEEIS